MSLPFSRFSLIKGFLATCLSHIGAFFLGGCGMGWGGRLPRYFETPMNVKPHCCSFFVSAVGAAIFINYFSGGQ